MSTIEADQAIEILDDVLIVNAVVEKPAIEKAKTALRENSQLHRRCRCYTGGQLCEFCEFDCEYRMPEKEE